VVPVGKPSEPRLRRKNQTNKNNNIGGTDEV